MILTPTTATMQSLISPLGFPLATGSAGATLPVPNVRTFSLYNLEDLPRPSQMDQLCDKWRPYQSVASWYMWSNNKSNNINILHNNSFWIPSITCLISSKALLVSLQFIYA